MILESGKYLNNEEVISSNILDITGTNYLISGYSDGTIILWDYINNYNVKMLKYHKGQINTMTQYNNGNNFAAGGYDGIITLWEIQINPEFNNMGGNQKVVDINLIKSIQYNCYIYSITNLKSRSGDLIIVDSHKKIKFLDTQNFNFYQENDRTISSEPILDVLTLKIKQLQQPLMLCFTTTQMILVDGNNFEPLRYFSSSELQQNYLGYSMSSCNKVMFIPNVSVFDGYQKTEGGGGYKSSRKYENFQDKNVNNIYLAIVDQSSQTNKILSIFSLNLQ